MPTDTKIFCLLAVALFVATIVVLSIFLTLKPSSAPASKPPSAVRVKLEDDEHFKLATVERIGTAPTCNPTLGDCQSKGMVYDWHVCSSIHKFSSVRSMPG